MNNSAFASTTVLLKWRRNELVAVAVLSNLEFELHFAIPTIPPSVCGNTWRGIGLLQPFYANGTTKHAVTLASFASAEELGGKLTAIKRRLVDRKFWPVSLKGSHEDVLLSDL